MRFKSGMGVAVLNYIYAQSCLIPSEVFRVDVTVIIIISNQLITHQIPKQIVISITITKSARRNQLFYTIHKSNFLRFSLDIFIKLDFI